jgi:hypothetical protein
MNCICHSAGIVMFPMLSLSDVHELLMSATCWPFGDCETVIKQLRETADNTDGSLDAAISMADKKMKEAMEVRDE